MNKKLSILIIITYMCVCMSSLTWIIFPWELLGKSNISYMEIDHSQRNHDDDDEETRQRRIRNIFRSSSHGTWKIKYKNKYKSCCRFCTAETKDEGNKVKFHEPKSNTKKCFKNLCTWNFNERLFKQHNFFLEIVVSLFPKLKINQSILTTLLIVTLEDFLIKFNLKKNTTCTSFKVYEKIFSSHYHHCLSFYTMGNACELFRDRNM